MVMSGSGRLALCAYAATLLAAAALLPLLDSPAWLVQTAVLLGAVSLTGLLARRLPLARPLVVTAQGLVGLMLLTLLFAREQAFLGIVPVPGSLARFGELLALGAEDVQRYTAPAPDSEGIRLMAVAGVLLIGLMVDLLAVTFRSAAPAGLPLLALYSVATGLAGGSASALWFVLAACGYLVLLLAEGRDRLSQWGRVFGRAPGPGGPKAFQRDGSPVAPVRTGRRIGVLALGVALAVPAVLPALDGGLFSGSTGGGSSDGGGGGAISAVNPLVSLQDNLNQPTDREVLRYRTNAPDTRDLYLRIVALDRFDGTSWKSSERKVEKVPDRLPGPPGLKGSVAVREIRTNFTAADAYRQNWLPMPYPATEVDVKGRWRFEPAGRTLVGDRGQTTRDARYSVTSLLVKPTAAQLAAAPPPPEDILKEYTKVPDVLPAEVKSTAERVTRGASNDYERAVRLQDWFAVGGGFTYDTQVASGTGVAAITRFLRNKEGFCMHFSFAMASMARTLGIPARVAIGFTPGTPGPGDTMSVSIRDAHAWPELYFEGVGWTRFEPTPTRGTVPEYTQAQDSPSDVPSDPASPGAATPGAPSAAPSASESCAPEARRAGECGTEAAEAAGTPADPSGPGTSLPLGPIGLAVAAVVVPLLPMLWRLRTTSRRLRGGGRTPADAGARVLAAWLEVCDTAWDHGIPPDDSLTPRRAAARIVRQGRLEGPAAEAVERVAGAVEQVLYAPAPRPVTGLADEVAVIRAGLAAGAGRVDRLRARLLPRSSVRVIRAAADRLHAVSASGAALLRGGRGKERLRGLLRRPG
jgi:transglutaminase-like putative cysteine protease